MNHWHCPNDTCQSRLPPKAYVCPNCKSIFNGNWEITAFRNAHLEDDHDGHPSFNMVEEKI